MLALNRNANRTWLSNYAADTTYIKDVAIIYPMLYDENEGVVGATFDAYNAITSLLPCIFLVDQSGVIRLRYDVANDPPEFWEHLEEITTTIDSLLANPPSGI